MAVLDDPKHRQFTAEEVLRMVEVGILSDDEPLELLDGELIFVSPQDPQHVVATEKVRRALERAAGERWPGRLVTTTSPARSWTPCTWAST